MLESSFAQAMWRFDATSPQDRRAGRIRKGTSKLAKVVDAIKIDGVPGVRTIFKATVDHRAVLVLRGEKLSRMVSDVDPKEEGAKIAISKALDGSEEAKRTSAAINEFVKRSHEALREHPLNQERANNGEKAANIVLTRGAGTIPNLPSFKSMFDLRGTCISGTPMVQGIAMAAGMEVMHRLVGEGKRVLELGCATGYLAEALGERGCTVWAVESDAEAAEEARPHVEEAVWLQSDLSDATPSKALTRERTYRALMGFIEKQSG